MGASSSPIPDPSSPTARALPESVRPEPVEGGPPLPSALAFLPPTRHCFEGKNPARESCGAGEAVRPEGNRRGNGGAAAPNGRGWRGALREPRPSRRGRAHPPCAPQHTNTASLPPQRCLRYRLPMEVAISHRNHNSTSPHAVGTASLLVGGMVRIDGQRGPVKQQEGLFPICKKIFGFVAATCQVSYKSIAKTTCRSHAARIPAEEAILVPARPPFALRALEWGPLPTHTDTNHSRQRCSLRYPSPMERALKELQQDITTTSAPWRSSPAWSVSTTTCRPAPDSRRLFLTGAKMVQRFL